MKIRKKLTDITQYTSNLKSKNNQICTKISDVSFLNDSQN